MGLYCVFYNGRDVELTKCVLPDEGKKCSYFKLLDMNGEKRGPCIGDHL